MCRVLPCGFLRLLFGIKKCWRGRAAVLNRDLKGLGFPKVTTESGKAVTAFSYTWFTWPVVEFLKMHYLGSALTSPKSFKTARDCASDSLVKFHITFVQLPDDYKMRG